MFTVAALQYEPILMDVETNLASIHSLLSPVNADLIVLPELCNTGYVFNTMDEVKKVSEPVPTGKTFIFFTNLSRELNASIVYGFAERHNDEYYNSCALVNPDGSYYIYRKTHLFYKEKQFFSPGDTGFFVCPAKDGVLIGMMICFDWQFPEAARSLALQGAQIICHPSNLVLPWCQKAMTIRSLENRIFTITANRIGTETNGAQSLTFTGQSQITDITGNVLHHLSDTETGLCLSKIDPELADNKKVTDTNDAFSDRRPAYYTALIKGK